MKNIILIAIIILTFFISCRKSTLKITEPGPSFFLGKKKEAKKNRLGLSFAGVLVFEAGGRFSLYERRLTFAALSCLLATSQRLFLGAIILGSRDSLS